MGYSADCIAKNNVKMVWDQNVLGWDLYVG